MWKLAIAAVAGFAVGVIVTRQAAINKATSAIHTGVSSVLGTGAIAQQTESILDNLVTGN